MASVAKDRRAEERGCDEAEDRSSALVGVWKRGSLGQPSQRPLRPRGGSHPIEKISHRSSSYNNGCVGVNHARCWSDERKCKIQEGNIKNREKADWWRKSGSAQTGGGSEIQHALHRASYRVS
jgi:hypothetical protein